MTKNARWPIKVKWTKKSHTNWIKHIHISLTHSTRQNKECNIIKNATFEIPQKIYISKFNSQLRQTDIDSNLCLTWVDREKALGLKVDCKNVRRALELRQQARHTSPIYSFTYTYTYTHFHICFFSRILPFIFLSRAFSYQISQWSKAICAVTENESIRTQRMRRS